MYNQVTATHAHNEVGVERPPNRRLISIRPSEAVGPQRPAISLKNAPGFGWLRGVFAHIHFKNIDLF